jgi:hypothetical protein
VGVFSLLECALKLEEWWQFCKSQARGHRVPWYRNEIAEIDMPWSPRRVVH